MDVFKCFIKWDVCQGCMYTVSDMGRSENVEDSINYSSFKTVSRNAAGWKEEVNG